MEDLNWLAVIALLVLSGLVYIRMLGDSDEEARS